jgi:hypothetical protein
MSMEVTLEKLGKRSDRSLAQEPCKKTHCGCVCTSLGVTSTPRQNTTIHGSDIQTAAGRWLGEIHLSYCPCCMRRWSCACLGWELFVVMIVTGAFDVEHESKVFFSTNTEVVPNES